MALLFAPAPPFSASLFSSSLIFPIADHQLYRLSNHFIASQQKLCTGYRCEAPVVLKGRLAFIVFALSDDDGTYPSDPESPEETDEESLPIQNLPLESKLQLKLEQKMRMKVGKKIRLRRKKLVRKRRLRKRGRWPPSKLKKNKNV